MAVWGMAVWEWNYSSVVWTHTSLMRSRQGSKSPVFKTDLVPLRMECRLYAKTWSCKETKTHSIDPFPYIILYIST